MLRPCAPTQHARRAFSSTRASSPRSTSSIAGRTAVAVASVAAGLSAYALLQQQRALELDAEADKGKWAAGGAGKAMKPEVFLWGRNTHGVVSPSSPSAVPSTVKRPSASPALSSFVLRDLALSATYGVAVDARGDVLQWGAGYSADGAAVENTLTGKDLVKVVPTEEGKVFALSKKGDVWVFASDKAAQRPAGQPLDIANGARDEGWLWVLGKGTLWGRNGGSHIEALKVGTDVKLGKGEKFTSLSAGASHLLALTSHGRSFALPLCLSANTYGQLGVRSVSLLAPPHPGSSPAGALTVRLEPDERPNELDWAGQQQARQPKKIDPLLLPAIAPPTAADPSPKGSLVPSLGAPSSLKEPAQVRLHADPAQHAALERSIHFCTTLHEIPALKGVEVAELVAGKKHSLARLGGKAEGRVLGWGANNYGQLGLGPSLSYPLIPVPTEIPFLRSVAYTGSNKSAHISCERVAAGGNVSYFVTRTQENGVDLLATGQGQFGALGYGQWAHATSPVRVKSVSGLREWSEKTGKVEFVGIKDVQAGEGHVAVVLDNAVQHGDGSAFGRDVFVWGYNEHYQLGTGRRSNLPTPQHLAPLPYPGSSPTAIAAAPAPATVEGGLTSGTTSPMPHKRMQLSPSLPAPSLKDARLPRGTIVEEAIVAGDGGSGVYWRVVNP
ncbi:hypothetical protein JCM10449v2_001637 [Rhodotorula kratochvilovae]